MPTHLDRYLAGEHEQVWDELLALGAAVREQPLYDDALAVARETMRRARYNVELIVAKLKASGYVFASSKVLTAAEANVIQLLDSVEESAGSIPMSLRAWYEQVDNLDLTGTHPDWDVCGCPPLCGDLNPSFLSRMIFDVEMTYEKRAAVIRRDTELNTEDKHFRLEKLREEVEEEKSIQYGIKPFVSTSLFRVTTSYLRHYGRKRSGDENVCGVTIMTDAEVATGGFTGTSEIIAPDLGADGFFRYPDLNIAPTFVAYLRRSFRWGGFPGFANVDESLRPTAMLAQLTEGLLPI